MDPRDKLWDDNVFARRSLEYAPALMAAPAVIYANVSLKYERSIILTDLSPCLTPYANLSAAHLPDGFSSAHTPTRPRSTRQGLRRAERLIEGCRDRAGLPARSERWRCLPASRRAWQSAIARFNVRSLGCVDGWRYRRLEPTQTGVSPGVPCVTVTAAGQVHEPEVGTIRGGDGRIPIQRKDRGSAAPSLAGGSRRLAFREPAAFRVGCCNASAGRQARRRRVARHNKK